MKGLKTKVAVVDDHIVFRLGIISILEDYEDIEVVFQAENGLELIEKLKHKDIDVILLDIRMPKLSGLEALKEIRQTNSTLKIIMLSVHEEENFIHQSLRSHANGYLSKDALPDEIYFAIQSCRLAGSYISEKINTILLKHLYGQKKIGKGYRENPITFSEKEVVILDLLMHEMTTTEIAKEMRLNPRSVEVSRRSMMERTNSKNTIGLLIYALKHSIIGYD